jgi:hypothetical protein
MKKGKGKPRGPTVGARIVEGLDLAIAATPAAPAPEPFRWPEGSGYTENHVGEWCRSSDGVTLCDRNPLGDEVVAAVPPNGRACMLCQIRKEDRGAIHGG